MDDFRLIYRILRILQKSMDCEEIDRDILSPERLELSVPKWNRIMSMLINEGYITGGQTWNAMDCGYPRVTLTRPEITLKGLEYLEENTLMKKAASLAKGIKDTIPGL
ncbi:YjcQ family protein [Enterocloster lavalensis]|uniref:YjcQ family protein n=1 Tax=Enterocloster lavalensis TaxID=460384 RepID=UPI000B890846|nr:YjcQ family protein [Enterocloster lavalensis]